MLLRGAEDRRIQDFFIQQAFPPRELVGRVLECLEMAGEEGATARDVMASVNLGRGRVDALLKVLDVEGAVTRNGSRWSLVPGKAVWVGMVVDVHVLRLVERRAHGVIPGRGVRRIPVHDRGPRSHEERVASLLQLRVLELLSRARFLRINAPAPSRGGDSTSGDFASSLIHRGGGGCGVASTACVLAAGASECDEQSSREGDEST